MRRLDYYLPQAISQFPDAHWVKAGVAAREALAKWNSEGSVDELVAPLSSGATGATIFESRHSVRDFTSDPVPSDLLHEAVRLASYSPSVCNREPWGVYLFSGADTSRVLAHQSGNSGFGDSVPAVALVSVDLGHFAKVGERNQAFIEGGIFATSLVFALHTLGLGSCMLNLSLTTDRLDALRAEVGAPQSEVLIMMIAIGYARPDHRYAASARRVPANIIAHG
ncbi:MAG: nitroreductase family protein [Rhodoglobus sp.]